MAERSGVEPGGRSSLRPGCGCLGAILVAFGLGGVIFVFLAAAWSDCNAGDEAWRSGAATLYSAVAALLTGAAFFSAATALRGQPRATRLIASAGIATLLGYLLLGGFLPASASVIDAHRGTCPGNVPPWWPSWLPI
jgi:hypothetical protein